MTVGTLVMYIKIYMPFYSENSLLLLYVTRIRVESNMRVIIEIIDERTMSRDQTIT